MGSTLDPENFPHGRTRKTPKGHDVRAVGPSDSSDAGSDLLGANLPGGLDDTTDRNGTGERVDIGQQRPVHAGADIDTDRVVDADEAGLGYGLDEAEQETLDDESPGR